MEWGGGGSVGTKGKREEGVRPTRKAQGPLARTAWRAASSAAEQGHATCGTDIGGANTWGHEHGLVVVATGWLLWAGPK
jgi:hypothetical protein